MINVEPIAKIVHDTLRDEGWNDLHSWDDSGEDTQRAVRIAVYRALVEYEFERARQGQR